MIISEPSYYASFRCIASACPDSCCKDWDVLLDEETVKKYLQVPGELGDRLRSAIRTEDGESILCFDNGRCPFWRADGLCQVQSELGESMLCSTCREYPRIAHDYGDFKELELELSCPEAARIILSSPATPRISREVPGGEPPVYDRSAMALLQTSRTSILEFLQTPGIPVSQLLQTLLLYAYEIDESLNYPDFTPEDFQAENYAHTDFPDVPGTMQDIFAFFSRLEILTDEWKTRLAAGPVENTWDPRFPQLIRYFTERYWLQAVSDFDLASRAKFIVISCLMIRHMGGDLIRAAQLYSKEIENDSENMDALLDGAFSAPEFRDAILLRLLK